MTFLQWRTYLLLGWKICRDFNISLVKSRNYVLCPLLAEDIFFSWSKMYSGDASTGRSSCSLLPLISRSLLLSSSSSGCWTLSWQSVSVVWVMEIFGRLIGDCEVGGEMGGDIVEEATLVIWDRVVEGESPDSWALKLNTIRSVESPDNPGRFLLNIRTAFAIPPEIPHNLEAWGTGLKLCLKYLWMKTSSRMYLLFLLSPLSGFQTIFCSAPTAAVQDWLSVWH